MKERIKAYMDYKGISAGELSVSLGVQRSNISHILNGRNKPGALFIEKLLITYPDLNARWLLTGEGSMTGTSDPVQKEIPVPQASQDEPPREEAQLTESEPAPVEIPSIPLGDQSAELEKIVLLYSDGTFKDFKRTK